MIKSFYTIIIALSFIMLTNISTKAGPDFDPKITLNSNTDYSKVIKERDYNNALKMHQKIAGSVLGFEVNFQIGFGSTSANVDQNTTTTSKTVSTQNNGGFTIGALVNLNLLGIFDLTTGLDFINKKYSYSVPYTDPTQIGDSISNGIKNNYLNIPLNINYGGMISDDIGLSFSGGPYFGLLLNPDNAVNGFKDFDFGLNGILTGKYYLNPFMSILLGTNVQFGGLNNLLSTGSISSLSTVNWGAFTGLGIGF